MLVTVTFDISTPDQKYVLYTDIFAYVDIEVTRDEYERIGESFEKGCFRGMYEDESLSDICDRCREELRSWGFKEEYGINFLFRFDYPIETRIDHSRPMRFSEHFEGHEQETIPSNARLLDNGDGTYTIGWSDESA